MCIRDSIYEVDDDRLLIVQTDRLSAFDVILPTPVPGKGQVCLLYTSDAADERSSVDLGGRRIIKKKIRV